MGKYTKRRESLTPREEEILQLIAEGLTNEEIGRALHISQETIKTHVRHVLATLHARSRTHAVAIGMRRGVVR